MIDFKKIIKILTSSVTALALMSASLSVTATEEYESDSTSGYEAELMEGLGIIENSDPEKLVTRVDFFQMISKMVYFGENSDYTNVPSGDAPFSDVDSYHYAASNIQRLLSAGIISGDGNGYAEPERNITAFEAYAIMLNAAGYKNAVAAYGNYPDGYIKLATELGLSKYVSTQKETITRGEAAIMLARLLDVKVMQIDSFASDKAEYSKKGSFAEEIMNLKIKTDIVYAAEGLTLSNKKYDEKTIVIGNDVLDNQAGGYGELLGYSVKYYCYDNELIYAMPYRNTVLKIDSEDIESYGNRAYKYTDNNDKLRNADTDLNVILMSNGYISDNLSDFTPNYGGVTLVDNDRDGIYDIIFSENYETAWVESIVSDGNTISFYNSIGDNEKTISLDDYEEFIIINDDGTEASFDSICQNQLLTIKRFKKEKTEVIISNTSVSGTVQNIKKYDKYTKLSIDDEKYIMNNNAYKKLWNDTYGVNVTAHLDARGHISAVIGAENTGWQYGYLIRARYIEEDETLQLKMLTQGGTVQKYIVTEPKIRIDGEKKELLDAAENFLSPSLVRYFMKNDVISSIDMPKDAGMTESKTVESKNSNNLLLKRAGGKLIYISKGVFKRNTINSIDGEIIPKSKNIPVFMVPSAEELQSSPDTQFSVETISTFKNSTAYTLEGFNTDPNDWYTDVIVAYGAESGGGTDAPMMISCVDVCVDSDDTLVYCVEGYVNGN